MIPQNKNKRGGKKQEQKSSSFYIILLFLIVGVGTLFLLAGYRLDILGVNPGKGTLLIKVSWIIIKIDAPSPGTIFAALGAIIIYMIIKKLRM